MSAHTPIPFTPSQLSPKSQFTSLGSAWNPTWESILRLDPTYFSAHLSLRLVPLTKQYLSPKIQELLLLAIAPLPAGDAGAHGGGVGGGRDAGRGNGGAGADERAGRACD